METLILDENCEKWKLLMTFWYVDMIEQSMCLHMDTKGCFRNIETDCRII